MRLFFTPGNAFGCQVNSHRAGWNGSICAAASTWDCAARQDFRDAYCAQLDDRCFHLHLFDGAQTSLVIDDNGAGWFLETNADLLKDQILLLWAHPAAEPRGIRSRDTTTHVIGAYRVRQTEKLALRYKDLWRISPYEDGWTRFPRIPIKTPRYRKLEGPYMREIDAELVIRMFSEIADEIESGQVPWWDEGDHQRFQQFHTNLGTWFEQAGQTAAAIQPPEITFTRVVRESDSSNRPVVELRSPRSPLNATQGASILQDTSKLPGFAYPVNRPATPLRTVADPIRRNHLSALVEENMEDWIRDAYGDETLKSLKVAALSKPIVIISGPPGVGKSHLAVRMLDDPKNERTIVVPVSATWRGREDLLGYVNPVSNQFEATELTRFLLDAEAAWNNDDKRSRVVVFEEFNLSHPEHWLSDILVLCEHADPKDRGLALGGERIRGQSSSDSTKVVLSPAIRFVATINSDHTTESLSPRVMDRAAMVTLRLEARDALARTGVAVEPDHVACIEDLDFLLSRKGASFSLRSALSLQACYDQLESLKIDQWQAVDIVLVQEVLSKVRLLARDPSDEELLHELEKWSEQHGRKLSRCARVISEWKESINAGIDVLQA